MGTQIVGVLKTYHIGAELIHEGEWHVSLSLMETVFKRRYPRVGLDHGICVAWQGFGERFVSRIVTVGLGGLFIRVNDPPPVGDVIRLFFEVPGGEIRARAVIRSVVPGKGMGIQFTSMGPEARGRLTQMLRRLLHESPDLAQKDP